MKDTLLEETKKSERLRRIRASASAVVHKKKLNSGINKELVAKLLSDSDMSRDEMNYVLSRYNGNEVSIHFDKIRFSKNIEPIRKLLSEDLLSPEQKAKVVNEVKSNYIENISSEDGFGKVMSSHLFSEDEKNNVLFSINKVREGTFESEKITIDDLVGLAEECDGL